MSPNLIVPTGLSGNIVLNVELADDNSGIVFPFISAFFFISSLYLFFSILVNGLLIIFLPIFWAFI
jgi:hypothetical protein